MSWMSLAEFKVITGMTLSQEQIQAALKYAASEIKKYTFVRQAYVSSARRKVHILGRSPYDQNVTSVRRFGIAAIPKTPIADKDMDGEITVGDIFVYEIPVNYNLDSDANITDDGFRELNDKVRSVNIYTNSVIFNDIVPTTTNKQLVIEYFTTKYRIEESIEEIKSLQKIIAVNYLLQNTPAAALEDGISSWNLNGVSVSYAAGDIQQIIKMNDEWIKKKYTELAPMMIRKGRWLAATPEDLQRWRYA